ncbi:hypothetical protein K2173_017176 [Erythroxylum novogranatense]|uniref:SPX domain-containing protein n=1 Tax=Erythroxylum novogranatense TaxID=1862640 RepID=A0AAV8U616_9ROSI|nr:hypothetical protein K2173_017176 [Erythroxylum novogranatense]
MKYGKRLREEVERTFPEWRGEFISYKELKRQLKLIYPCTDSETIHDQVSRFVAGELFNVNTLRESNGFAQLLDNEVNKAITFFNEKEEDYIIRLKELQIRAANLENPSEKLQVQKDILDFRAEMVLLLHYSVLNFTGLIKIVKKHNKRTGTCFQFSSMRRVMQQPSFSTDLLHQLMEECEVMLYRLFLSDGP